MKKFLVTLACLVVSSLSYAGAAAELSRLSEPGRLVSLSNHTGPSTSSGTVKLNDGPTVRVDVCDNGIFRVRISPRKEF